MNSISYIINKIFKIHDLKHKSQNGYSTKYEYTYVMQLSSDEIVIQNFSKTNQSMLYLYIVCNMFYNSYKFIANQPVLLKLKLKLICQTRLTSTIEQYVVEVEYIIHLNFSIFILQFSLFKKKILFLFLFIFYKNFRDGRMDNKNHTPILYLKHYA